MTTEDEQGEIGPPTARGKAQSTGVRMVWCYTRHSVAEYCAIGVRTCTGSPLTEGGCSGEEP